MFSNFTGRQGIFNRRRRPRQAVYASPQSQNGTSELQIDIPDIADETLAEIAQGFESTPKNFSYSAPKRNSFNPTYNNSTRPSQQNKEFPTPQKHPNNQYNNNNSMMKKPKLEKSQRSSCKENNDSFVQRQTPYNRKNSFSLNSVHQNGPRSKFSQFENTMKKPQESYSGQKSQFYGNSPEKVITPRAQTRPPQYNDRSSYGTSMTNQKIKNENPAVQNEVSSSERETGFSIQTLDKSMKFITSTIQGVKKWSEYREQLPLVFEIFATLDSVPTSNNNSTAKLFNIKDNSGSTRCIYWEMDHKLPRMARGQLYRMVGAMERRTSCFQCFTIRQAQPNEQCFVKQQVETCDNAMMKLTSMIAEA